MGVFLWLALLGFLPFLGVVLVKTFDQNQRDRNRKTYRLHFPAQLDEACAVAWIRSISGTLRASKPNLVGAPTLAFEMWATSEGIRHRIKVPWQHADYIVSQLRSLVPGIRVEPEEEFPRRIWTRAVEVGLTHTARPLRILSVPDVSTSLLASVQGIDAEEAVVVQWVITPAIPTPKPVHLRTSTNQVNLRTVLTGSNLANRDEVNDRRAKLDEPNVMAVLRIGAAARTNERADHLIYRVRASLASTRSATTRFKKRMVSRKALQDRIDRTSGSLAFPMQLTATELTALIAWPIGNPFVSGLPPTLSRQLPAGDQVPRVGRVIGRSNFPGNERPVAVSHVDARRHVHVLGPTGVGKTVLLANMIKQDIEQGYGVVLIESKGDLFRSTLDYVPWARLKDAVVLDVSDTKRPIGFNVLQQGEPTIVVDEIVGLFEHLYSDTKSVWTRQVLYHALQTLITDPTLTFVDLAPLLAPMSDAEAAWSDDLIRSVRNTELKNFWRRFMSKPPNERQKIVQPVLDRIWQLNARPEIRNIIGQGTSSFLMSDIVRHNKLLLVNLSGLPRDTASLTGTLLMNALWHAVKRTPSDKPTFLYVDEFQDFVDLPVDAADMLEKARGFGLGMTLAHQHLNQLPKDMRDAVTANARTKIVFQTSADDSTFMAREMGRSVSDNDFMSLGQYEAIVRVATQQGISAPLTLSTSAPASPYYFKRELVTTSRRDYGRPVSVVEREIETRRTLQKPRSAQRPVIGTAKAWGQ